MASSNAIPQDIIDLHDQYFGGADQSMPETAVSPDADTAALHRQYFQDEPVGPGVTASGPPQPPAEPWGGARELGRAFTLGATVPVHALGRALGLPGHAPVEGDSTWEKFNNAWAEATRGRKAWETEHPGKTLAINIAGSTPAAAAAVGLTGGLAGVGLEAAGLGGAFESLPSAAQMVVRGVGGGAVAGAATAPLTDEPFAKDVAYGALAGPAAEFLAAPLRGAVAPAVLNLAQKFHSLVPLKTGQIPGAPKVAQALGSAVDDSQIAQANRVASQQFGENTPEMTWEKRWGLFDDKGNLVAPGAAQRIGKVMDRITSGTTIGPSEVGVMLGRQTKIVDNAINDLGVDSPGAKAIQRHANNITNSIDGAGTIPGTTYQTLTQSGSPLFRDMSKNADPAVRQYAREMHDNLSQAFDSVISPGDKAEWRAARNQYKDLNTIDPTIDESTGQVDFRKLARRVDNRNYDPRDPLWVLAHGFNATLGTKIPAKAKAGGLLTTAAEHPAKALGVGTIVGGAGLAAGEHLMSRIPETFATHPMETMAALTGPALYAGAGRAMNTPWASRAFLRAGGRFPNMSPYLMPGISQVKPGYNYLFGGGQ